MRAYIQKKSESGFSFIEAIFSMVILSLGFVGIMSLYANMNGNTENDSMKMVASKLASERIEQIMADKANLGYANINTGSTSDSISYDSLSFTRQTNIQYVNSSDLTTTSASDTGFKRVDVTVNWSNGGNQNVTVTGLVSNY